MRRFYYFLFSLLLPIIIWGQDTLKFNNDGQDKLIGGFHILPKPGSSIKLLDTLTNNTFVLDSAHIVIRGYNKESVLLWTTNPYYDNKIDDYKTNQPIVVNFYLVTIQGPDNKLYNTLSVVYNNSFFGNVDLNNGAFHFIKME
jgi:hypothetical protein